MLSCVGIAQVVDIILQVFLHRCQARHQTISLWVDNILMRMEPYTTTYPHME